MIIYLCSKLTNMIKEKVLKESIEVDLTGPDGNSFFLLGLAGRLSNQLGFDSKHVQSEMMKGDYEHLVKTFDNYFGDFVTLYR